MRAELVGSFDSPMVFLEAPMASTDRIKVLYMMLKMVDLGLADEIWLTEAAPSVGSDP